MYLDPGFGGMLVQIIVAVVAAGGATMFAFRKKLRAAFSKDKGEGQASTPPKAGQDSEGEVIDVLADDN